MFNIQPKLAYRILSLLFVFLFSVTTTNASAIIPSPNGQYGVSLSIIKLTDKTRIDPFSPHRQFRSVVLSVFYPAVSANQCNTTLVDYMPPATAAIEDQFYGQYGLPNGTFERLKLSLCKDSAQMARHLRALGQSVASFGRIVVLIDHPYDANVVEFPDSTLILGANISTRVQIDLALDTRARDVSFVLDQLSLPSIVRNILPSAKGGLKTRKTAMYGHSLGGATTAAAMLKDDRILGGVNLDGSFYGQILDHSLNRPFLIFGHQGKNQSTDASWKAAWPELKGWKLELMLHGATHATFTDLPLLVQVLGLDKVLPPQAEVLLGALNGARARDIASKYVTAFFDFAQEGISSSLLQGTNKAFPEVSVVASGGSSQG